jgi:hypothetical protein
VDGTPEFRLPAYVCFPTRSDSESRTLAVELIRRVTAEAE